VAPGRHETLFGIDPSILRAEEGRRFAWRDPESHFGIVTSYEAWFENGALASASRRFGSILRSTAEHPGATFNNHDKADNVVSHG
jgi:hypothetical protein